MTSAATAFECAAFGAAFVGGVVGGVPILGEAFEIDGLEEAEEGAVEGR